MNRWEYLSTEPFKSRYALAAHYLKEMPHVIEIGGYTNCISDYLPTETHVIAVDPLCDRENAHRLECFKSRMEDMDWGWTKGAQYGVVALGIDFQGDPLLVEKQVKTLAELVAGAEVSILETPEKFPPGTGQMWEVVLRSKREVWMKILLDLSGNHLQVPKDSFPPFYERRMLILR